MVKDEVKYCARADIKIRVIEKAMLHVLFIEFTVDLCSGSLYMTMKSTRRRREKKLLPRLQRLLNDSKLETEYQPRLKEANNAFNPMENRHS
jgi:sensor c-di-GMP phosphodiesterase-like protein